MKSVVFRASRDGWEGSNFHKRADEFQKSILIVKSTQGCIFGGFNPYGWKSLYVSTPLQNPFLFSLQNENRNQIPVRNHKVRQDINQAITQHNNFESGPRLTDQFIITNRNYQLTQHGAWTGQIFFQWNYNLCSNMNGQIEDYELISVE